MKTLLRMMPLPSHSPTRAAMRSGRDQMKGSTRKRLGPVAVLAPSSQPRMTTTRMPTCSPGMSQPLRVPLPGIAGQHLLAQVAPDPLVDIGEAGREARLDHVARPRQLDGVVAFD